MTKHPIIKNLDQVPAKEVDRARGASLQILLGPEEDMPHFYTRQFTIQPGGFIPPHRHDLIEHEQFILEGEMVLTLEGEERMVKTGQCIYIPANMTHAYENRSDQPIRFLCMIPAIANYATEWV